MLANTVTPYPIVIVTTCVANQKLEFNTATNMPRVSPSEAYPNEINNRKLPAIEPIKIPEVFFRINSINTEKRTIIKQTNIIDS